MTTQEIFEKKQILSLEGAKARMGMQIACAAPEYRMNEPKVLIFRPMAIISEYDLAKSEPLEGYTSRADYWDKSMSYEQLDRAKNHLIMIDEKNQRTYGCYLQSTEFSVPVFTGSDTDRPVYFVEM